jgi:hypothetical protein
VRLSGRITPHHRRHRGPPLYGPLGEIVQETWAIPITCSRPSTSPAADLGNAIGGPGTKTFAYDDLYRLSGCHVITATGCLNTPPTGAFTYSFSQSYDSIHNITHKTQTAMQNSAVNPQTTYDWAYTCPAPRIGASHVPTAIGEFNTSGGAAVVTSRQRLDALHRAIRNLRLNRRR